MKRRRYVAPTIAILVFIAGVVASVAADPPRGVWIKAKCALCHGEDGSSNTPAGKQTKALDLRSADIQKLTDAELTKRISDGHLKMPSFKSMAKNQVPSLVFYIRDLAKKPAQPSRQQANLMIRYQRPVASYQLRGTSNIWDLSFADRN